MRNDFDNLPPLESYSNHEWSKHFMMPDMLLVFQTILVAIIHIMVLLVLLWDVYVLVRWGRQYTISSIIMLWARSNPILPLTFGLVAGHLFWPQ